MKRKVDPLTVIHQKLADARDRLTFWLYKLNDDASGLSAEIVKLLGNDIDVCVIELGQARAILTKPPRRRRADVGRPKKGGA